MSSNRTTQIFKILQQLLTKFFHALYHSWAWSYDIVAWMVSFGMWNSWVQTTRSYLQGNRILEIGPGPGHFLSYLTLQGFQVWGLDESWQMLKLCQNNNRKRGISPSVSQGLAQSLPFCDHSFDCIVSTFPTQYIFHQNTISETCRVLKPQGMLIILLGVRIIGTSLPYRILAAIYRLTGESLDKQQNYQHIMEPFLEESAYEGTLAWNKTTAYELLFLICKKNP